ncbi:hypothetical protein [Flavobacterium pectinovorum]|uniref:GLPGLI family protein n=1 Tax=Flavobacterium pectinovorum TaxID=29533 RepID=A0A502F7H1_9FLAO|nr:hypothetical protein [Flavobacterium pectinovorum]TPG45310.1 hypothetical protein EAH81_01540 [Flavobacterium pectinovorum]
MKLKILLVLLFFTLLAQAQTKVIAHKSHSGSKNSFAKAYKNNLFDISHSNFGLPEHKIIILDTVIAVHNSLTILKIRESIHTYTSGVNYKNLKKSDFKFKTTMISDSLFNEKNTVRYIKSAPPYRYPLYFLNSIDSVVFIGFKNPF